MNDKNENTLQTPHETVQDEIEQEFEVVGGVVCPIDPQERSQCDSCQ